MSEKITAAIKHPGLGAIPTAKGVTFRVWAPHAEKVYVTGTFNDWSKTSTPLAKEENGYWSTDVSGAKTGDEYRYLIYGPNGVLSRLDPYARKVTSSIGNGAVRLQHCSWPTPGSNSLPRPADHIERPVRPSNPRVEGNQER